MFNAHCTPYIYFSQTRNQAMAESELSSAQRYAVDNDDAYEDDSAEDSENEEGGAGGGAGTTH